jgi:amino acid transporter
MAKDGALLRGMAKLSDKRATPAFALLLFAIWSCILVMSGAYFQITKMVVYGLWLLYIPTAIAHMRLRSKRPDIERPFRTPLYPVLPIVFLVASVFIVYIMWFDPAHPAQLNKDWLYTAAATVVMLLAIPFYYMQRRNKPEMDPAHADTHEPPGTPPGRVVPRPVEPVITAASMVRSQPTTAPPGPPSTTPAKRSNRRPPPGR